MKACHLQRQNRWACQTWWLLLGLILSNAKEGHRSWLNSWKMLGMDIKLSGKIKNENPGTRIEKVFKPSVILLNVINKLAMFPNSTLRQLDCDLLYVFFPVSRLQERYKARQLRQICNIRDIELCVTFVKMLIKLQGLFGDISFNIANLAFFKTSC